MLQPKKNHMKIKARHQHCPRKKWHKNSYNILNQKEKIKKNILYKNRWKIHIDIIFFLHYREHPIEGFYSLFYACLLKQQQQQHLIFWDGRLKIHIHSAVFLYLCICLLVYLPVYLSICLSVCLFVCLFVCLSVCLLVCMYVFIIFCMYTCMFTIWICALLMFICIYNNA